MSIALSEREQALFDLLIAIPPEMVNAEQYLQENKLTESEVTRVAIRYADECFCDAGDFAWENNLPHTEEIIPELHSTHLYDVVNLLLRYGLDPNGTYDGDNIMHLLKYVDNEFLSADTIALLLEKGGKVDLAIPDTCASLFGEVDFDVFFDAIEQRYRQRYAALVHYWMVMIGYGARCGEGKMQVFREYDSSDVFDLAKLKNHRNYYFGITRLGDDFAISIYDKNTLWEVARIK